MGRVARKATAVCWSASVDDIGIYLTHGGAVYVEFPRRKPPRDPVAEVDRQREQAVSLMNLVACEFALTADVPVAAFSIAELASAVPAEDHSRFEMWTATRPFGHVAMQTEWDIMGKSRWVGSWEQASAEQVELLGTLEHALALRTIAEQLPSLIAGAVGHHQRGRAAEVTLFAWTVCELILDHGWKQRVLANASGAHRRALENTTNYTAAHRVEILWRDGWFAEELRDLLTSARKIRNLQAHQSSVAAGDATETMRAMFAMIRLCFAAEKTLWPVAPKPSA